MTGVSGQTEPLSSRPLMWGGRKVRARLRLIGAFHILCNSVHLHLGLGISNDLLSEASTRSHVRARSRLQLTVNLSVIAHTRFELLLLFFN